MKKKTRRLLSMLLALMLVATTLPGMTIFASGGGQPNDGGDAGQCYLHRQRRRG